MTQVGINRFNCVFFCDLCGKRSVKLVGSLKLMDESKQGHIYTHRSWKLCKKCFTKMGNLESVGDKIKEDIILLLDKLQVECSSQKLLDIQSISKIERVRRK